MSDTPTLAIPHIAREVPDGNGGLWFLDEGGNIVGGLSFATYPVLECVRLRTGEVERRLTEREENE